jgi:endonuclease/exonuclease/phosphatase family metal-dependent hydrolase
MSKHAGPPDGGSRYGAAVGTIAVVGLLGVVVSLMAILGRDNVDRSAPPVTASLVTDPSFRAPVQPVRTSDPVTAAPTSQSPRPRKSDRSGKPDVQRAQQQVGQDSAALRRRIDRLDDEEPTTFRVGSFNVLGASHTNPGGNKRGWASASARMALAVSALRAQDVDVVGLQEFESSQAHLFQAQTDGAWGVYPGASGGRGAVRQSIAWQKDTWELVSGATVPIPYFHGNRVPMPYVLLKNLASEQEVYFINVHNPATTKRWGDNQRWRTLAAGIELALANRLRAGGHPVLLMGDFNEQEEVFCQMTGGGTLRAANGGSTGRPCAAPANIGIDWIFGSPDIDFTDYVRHRSDAVHRATDHPLVATTATIAPADR